MKLLPIIILAAAAAGTIAATTMNTSHDSKPAAGTDCVTVRFQKDDGTPGEPVSVPRVERSEAEWKVRLTPEQFDIMREHGTERACLGGLSASHTPGTYACAGCGLPLFSATTKFESGTGWPSFFKPFAKENVGSTQDLSWGMVREEVHCARCGSHLGHVFPDGPAPTGLRYCINGASLTFIPEATPKTETVLLGAGCFWGVQEALDQIKGVVSTTVGYAGGHTKNPTYDQVCTHTTGHAEVVQVVYDPSVLKFRDLLKAFFAFHDPTTKNRQGPDIGDNYRSAIFVTTPEQESDAREVIADIEKSGSHQRPIVTQVDWAGPFTKAEDYHQKYAEKHGGGFCHVTPH